LEDPNIGRDLLIVLVTALAGGMLARLLRLPVILGYLIGGIIIGPYGIGTIGAFGGTGFVHQTETINTIAELGVVLLLFTIGLEFSLKEIRRMGRVALFGGIAQILLTAAAGFGLGKLVGLGTQGAVFFGFIVALSSTMVVLKILMERGELDTTHGRIMLGILLVQDISVVPIMVVMSALGGDVGELWTELGIAVAKAVGFIAVMVGLGVWGMPWFLRRVAGQRSRELFLLTVVVVCLAAAFGTYYFGLSAAFGAFVAGLLISQSGYARQAFADIQPLRDTFAALFFVSLGMLANLEFIRNNLSEVALMVAAIMVGKFVICSAITRAFGYSHKTVLMVGTGLIQVGEFSFIIALMGVETGILSERLFSLTIAAAIITMLLTPFAMSMNSSIYRWLSQRKFFAQQLAGRFDPDWQDHAGELSRHAVICGYGGIGSRVAAVLEKQKFPYLVIELDPNIISRLRAQGIPCIYGDASNPEILAHAYLDKARVLVCTVPDYVAVQLVTRNALAIKPKLDIVARVRRDSDVELIRDTGVTELVLPVFEGSLEMIRHTLHRFGMESTEIQYILNGLRRGQIEEPPEAEE
jgi:CPA2 family monovalent cation:H+ antiporter-2